ncbi:hypothetical protein [Sulfobacillus harzensis]|uniref:Uncharacterized protein n=1 Tax=Sulfobacillus harzensis TaxID=2729629 RepID=A0A7Y0L886_9FIRM|nr:hypothetical protein [Sulfobacillus harzensis]NMP25030.1 hypothetical protein [Sulfobacillus harzensis]
MASVWHRRGLYADAACVAPWPVKRGIRGTRECLGAVAGHGLLGILLALLDVAVGKGRSYGLRVMSELGVHSQENEELAH